MTSKHCANDALLLPTGRRRRRRSALTLPADAASNAFAAPRRAVCTIAARFATLFGSSLISDNIVLGVQFPSCLLG